MKKLLLITTFISALSLFSSCNTPDSPSPTPASPQPTTPVVDCNCGLVLERVAFIRTSYPPCQTRPCPSVGTTIFGIKVRNDCSGVVKTFESSDLHTNYPPGTKYCWTRSW